jgi:hypothetical protein
MARPSGFFRFPLFSFCLSNTASSRIRVGVLSGILAATAGVTHLDSRASWFSFTRGWPAQRQV